MGLPPKDTDTDNLPHGKAPHGQSPQGDSSGGDSLGGDSPLGFRDSVPDKSPPLPPDQFGRLGQLGNRTVTAAPLEGPARDRRFEELASIVGRARASDAYRRSSAVFALISFFFLFARPQEIVTPLGAARLPMFAAIIAGVLWIPRSSNSWTKVTKLMFLFLAVEGARGIFGRVIVDTFVENDHWAYQTWKDLFLQYCGVIFPIATMCSSGIGIRKFFRLFFFVSGLLSIYIITHGGVGPGGFIQDENDAGFVMLFFLPYSMAILTESRSSFAARVPLLFVSGLAVLAIIATVSRGDFLGLIAVLAYFFWRSQKKFQLVLVSFLLFLAVLPAISGTYIKEMRSISDTDTGTAQIRRHYWKLAWRIVCDPKNTLWGVGLSNTPYNLGRYETGQDTAKFPSAAGRKTHSMYFEVLPDLGVWGAFIYLSILATCFTRNNKFIKRITLASQRLKSGGKTSVASETLDPGIRAASRHANFIRTEIEHVRPYLIGTNVAFVAIMTAGAFISVAYYPPFWMLAGITAMLELYLARILPSAEEFATLYSGESGSGKRRGRGHLLSDPVWRG